MGVVLAEPGQRLDDVLGRLRALHPGWPHVYAVDPAPAPGLPWQPLARALPAVLSAAVDAAPGRSAAVAATSVGAALGHAVLGRLTAAVVTGGVSWDVGPGALLVALDEDDYPARVALAPGARVSTDGADAAALDRVAHQAVATLAPLLGAVRERTRFGLLPLWGLAADAVLSAATEVPRVAGGGLADQLRGRALGEGLVAALRRHGARAGCRARCQHVDGPTGPTGATVPVAVGVRGTCCLAYRSDPAATVEGTGYCLTCPHVPDAVRARRWPDEAAR